MLRITQTYAQIGIETNNAQITMSSKRSQLQMQQEDVKLVMESEKPHVIIDQYECFAERGLKNNSDLLLEAKQISNQKVMEYIAKKVGDGKLLAAIEKGGNPIATIVKRDSNPQKSFGMVTIPKSRPKISAGGYLKIDTIPGKLEFSADPAQLEIQATRPEMRYYLLQRPSIQIQYVGENVDLQL